MGFNFQAGHPDDVLEPGSKVEACLRQRFGNAVPLGTRGDLFSVPDEMGWSWWSELQALAVERLGADRTRQITATDAWYAVYLDAEVQRELLWPDGKSDRPLQRVETHVYGGSWFSRLLERVGLRKRAVVSPEIDQVMAKMVQELGPRKGEYGALQVGNLRALMAELNELAKALRIEPNTEAIDAVRLSYSTDNERLDDDPAIQCFCHVWLTASHAIAKKAPLWLLK